HRPARLVLALPAGIEEFFAAGDQRHQARRRRRRIRYGIALTIATIVAVPAFVIIASYLSREQLIQSTMGIVDRVIVPFDWVASAPVPAGVDQVRNLSLSLYEAKA